MANLYNTVEQHVIASIKEMSVTSVCVLAYSIGVLDTPVSAYEIDESKMQQIRHELVNMWHNGTPENRSTILSQSYVMGHTEITDIIVANMIRSRENAK